MLAMTRRILLDPLAALLGRLRGDERGQVLVLGALLLVPLLGFAGLALDLGTLTKTRWQMQHTADAAALAGVQELPGCSGPAIARAEEWAQRGDYPPSAVEVTLEGAGCDTIRVQLRADVPLTFMRVFGIDERSVHGSASARIASVTSTRHFMPWGLTVNNSDCLEAGSPPQPRVGATCSLKISDGTETSGDRGALNVDGGGGAGYRAQIVSSTTAEPHIIGSTVAALPGNQVGPTDQGIAERLLGEPSSFQGVSCDSNGNGRDDFDEVFVEREAGGGPRYAVRYACQDSPRLMTVPIVDQISHPNPSTILGWATVYLESYSCVGDDSGKCDGKGHWAVTGRIVDAVWSDPEGATGAYQAGQPATWFLVD